MEGCSNYFSNYNNEFQILSAKRKNSSGGKFPAILNSSLKFDFFSFFFCVCVVYHRIKYEHELRNGDSGETLLLVEGCFQPPVRSAFFEA